ncbi:sugar transferase [Anaerocolumna jejuensis]|uniref:sugar transferase n=1 Tax=Anaerocolumna jejuensis TaxID=259063 RepID=UPI003F7B557E
MYIKYFKRILDFVGAFVATVLFSWLLLMIALLVKLTSKGPVLYKQKRIGRNKKEFYILKFRTMKISTPGDVPTHLLQNPEQYITGIGKFLRKSSLDELPQLLNILKGDMSFVGPRPALWNQYDLIEERDKYEANSIRPGLTGWAQVNGRDELPIPIKAEYDGEYFNKVSFLFDISCIFKTFYCVFKHKGVREGTCEVKKLYEESTGNWS